MYKQLALCQVREIGICNICRLDSECSSFLKECSVVKNNPGKTSTELKHSKYKAPLPSKQPNNVIVLNNFVPKFLILITKNSKCILI